MGYQRKADGRLNGSCRGREPAGGKEKTWVRRGGRQQMRKTVMTYMKYEYICEAAIMKLITLLI